MRNARGLSSAALALSLVLSLGACGVNSGGEPPAAVASLDLGRYQGHWFELAKYPNRFQTQCAGDTTADYELLPDGAVQVTNRCRTAGGATDQAVGRAERPDAGSEGRLKVRFAPRWLSWLPFVWGDYWVIDLDPDYSLAAVSDPKREFLWILSRSPSVDSARYSELIGRLRQSRFDTSRIVMTQQSGS